MNPAENYILDKPEPYRSILLHLQSVIERILPEVELKFKYRIPFYYINGTPFCYLNQSKDYVDLGFWKAAHLTVHQEHMISEGRKVIKSLRYRSLEGIDDSILIDVINEAYVVRDARFYK
ncbi:DUF1801 domain-containing protein [Zobellia amurskyensis]|uniref:DUF1801 domain-containing protein n=1 Tax=Zobellia amurskyensis TaxID=248905 RepID=A0A7X2ZR08_9FLAO|nr:DUF1801 domain-containing protein [Zobellia amurskyensis]MUH34810.1 DUF1801 domain-containing protein [Zobellia amurskyensis]